MRKRFNFIGADGDQRSLISYRLDLGEMPTVESLQQIFCDLYAQQRLDPHYVFVSAFAFPALRHQIVSYCGHAYGAHTGKSGDDLLQARIFSVATARLIDFVVLPGLEPCSVILGFFK